MKAPKVYVGLHHPADAVKVPRCMISANVLERRRAPIRSADWMLDSGAFSRISSGRDHLPARSYADMADRLNGPGLRAVVAQDWMCEPPVLEMLGASVKEHQDRTLERYGELRALWGPRMPYLLPVVQGFAPSEYGAMARTLAPEIDDDAWVGVGSVCKRQGNPSAIVAVLDAILDAAPDWRLHGFGVKSTALSDPRVADRLWSIDSMAWSFAARMEGRDANSPAEAAAWMTRVEADLARPRQTALW